MRFEKKENNAMLEKSVYKKPVSATVRNAGATSTVIERPDDVDELPVANAANSENTARLSPETNTVIGSDVVFKGEVIAGSNIHIHGIFEGSIARETNNVVVGVEGRVKALVHASTVRILGQVDGDIYGDESVELMSGARVNGNIFCECVKIEKGAKFNGTVTMS